MGWSLCSFVGLYLVGNIFNISLKVGLKIYSKGKI